MGHRISLVARVGGLALGIAAATVWAQGWQDFFPLDEELKMEIMMQGDGTNDPRTFVGAIRGPLVAGSFEVTAFAKTESTMATEGVLTGIRFLTGDDGNLNGIIDPAEWQLVASATPGQSGGWTVAECQPATVSAFKDAYAVEFDWREPDGTTEWTGAEKVALANIDPMPLSSWSKGPPP
jgi:hypothetical protein